jgi:hypothetical protein
MIWKIRVTVEQCLENARFFGGFFVSLCDSTSSKCLNRTVNARALLKSPLLLRLSEGIAASIGDGVLRSRCRLEAFVAKRKARQQGAGGLGDRDFYCGRGIAQFQKLSCWSP